MQKLGWVFVADTVKVQSCCYFNWGKRAVLFMVFGCNTFSVISMRNSKDLLLFLNLAARISDSDKQHRSKREAVRLHNQDSWDRLMQ